MAHVIMVLAQGPNPSLFLFIRLGCLLGPGFGKREASRQCKIIAKILLKIGGNSERRIEGTLKY